MDNYLVLMRVFYLATQTEIHSDTLMEKYSESKWVYYLAENWDRMMVTHLEIVKEPLMVYWKEWVTLMV